MTRRHAASTLCSAWQRGKQTHADSSHQTGALYASFYVTWLQLRVKCPDASTAIPLYTSNCAVDDFFFHFAFHSSQSKKCHSQKHPDKIGLSVAWRVKFFASRLAGGGWPTCINSIWLMMIAKIGKTRLRRTVHLVTWSHYVALSPL